MDIYSAAMQTMRPHQIDHNRSHLYLLMTHQAMNLVREFRNCGGHVEEILDEDTNLYWYYIPYGYTPYWQKYMRQAVEEYAWKFISGNEFNGKLTDWSDTHFDFSFSKCCRVPPHRNFYPMIRIALYSILSAYPVYAPMLKIPA